MGNPFSSVKSLKKKCINDVLRGQLKSYKSHIKDISILIEDYYEPNVEELIFNRKFLYDSVFNFPLEFTLASSDLYTSAIFCLNRFYMEDRISFCAFDLLRVVLSRDIKKYDKQMIERLKNIGISEWRISELLKMKNQSLDSIS